MSFPRYAEYKDSGVEWLGEIPSGWGVKRHKYIATFLKGKNPDVLLDNYVNGLYPYLSMDSLRGKAESKYAKYGKGLILVEDNQPLIIWDGSNSGEFVLGKKGILSSTMASAFLLYELNSRFYWYMCVCIEPEMRKNATGMGIPHVNGEELRGISLPIPDIDEQTTIAAFLDHETAKLDNLINQQKKLIDLLKEKRQAVISHAVTKGLNPNAPMKDSGVEWLGKVPEGWGVIKFNHCVQIRNGLVDPRQDNYKNLVLYAPNHIEKGTGKIIYKETADEQGADSNKYLCFKGEVIYSKIRPALAKVAICEENLALCSADMYPMNGCNGLSNKFLYYFILSDSFTEAVILDSDRVAMPKINRESLSEYKLPIPPLEEQNRITDFIERTGFSLDKLEQQAESAIQLLQERRTALISAAVTGKIDVRGFVKT